MPPELESDQNREQAATEPLLRRSVDRLKQHARRAAQWVAGNRIRGILVFGAVVTSVAAVLAFTVVLLTSERFDKPQDLPAAISAWETGRYLEARRLAEVLRDQPSPTLETLAGTAFILGAVAAAEAERSYAADAGHEYLVAAEYLDEARDRGFPAGCEAEGLYLLGKSLFACGRFAESRPVLREALAKNTRRQSEIERLLSDAYLNDANPDYAKALEHNAALLADRMLLPHERNRGVLDRATILLRLGKTSECLETLSQIPDEAGNQAEALVIRAQVLMHEAAAIEQSESDQADREVEALQKYEEAVKMLRLAQSRDTLGAQVSGQAMYLIGVCFLKAGEDRAAWTQLDRTKRTYPGTSEDVAATFRQAELSRKLGQDVEALAGYQRVLRSIADPQSFHNRWLTLDELQANSLAAYREYLNAGKYESAVALAKLFYPLFSRARTLELVGEAYRDWGKNRLASVEHLPLSKSEDVAREGRLQYRRAGSIYQRLAELRVTTRQYPEDLWISAESYLAGANFTHAAEMFQKYLKNESRTRRPRALLGLGEARLALGQYDEAIESLSECIEFYPNDVATFRARLVAGNAYAEKGEYTEARRLLEENLSGDLLTPEAADWRASLFTLGRLLHTEGRYAEATAKLEEAQARYPNASETLVARYLIGECYLADAQQEKRQLAADLIPSTQKARAEKIHDQLQLALEWFRKAQKALYDHQASHELSSLESATLRNCSLAIGSVLFDLDRYDEAIEAYLAIVNRYKDSPTTLDAYVQMARSYGQLGRADEARRAVERAKATLSRIPAEDEFAATTIFSKQQWTELLDEMEKQWSVGSG